MKTVQGFGGIPDLLEQALFAPAKVAVFDVAQCVERAQTQSKQSGLGLKMNISGTTKLNDKRLETSDMIKQV